MFCCWSLVGDGLIVVWLVRVCGFGSGWFWFWFSLVFWVMVLVGQEGRGGRLAFV